MNKIEELENKLKEERRLRIIIFSISISVKLILMRIQINALCNTRTDIVATMIFTV